MKIATRRAPLGFLVAVATVGVLGVASAGSADPDAAAAARFAHIDITAAVGDAARGDWLPAAMRSRQATVMLRLAGQPVAAYQAAALKRGAKVSDQQRASIRADLKAKQDGLAGAIASAGGDVIAQLQDAYDGIMVRAALADLPKLRQLPGVTAVLPMPAYRAANVNGVPYIEGPTAWGTFGKTGAGVNVAIIDSGIDYTHANFGGPGTVAAFQDADAHDTAPPPASLVGPAAPKVKGGFDFVGDDYNAEGTAAQQVPHPDPNPLDCDHGEVGGHGSHTAGTLAGFGVLANGSTYTGPYDASTISSHSWTIGPGIAPKANIYEYRVFGCNGPSEVVPLAINQAVKDKVDVISMSLGSTFGGNDDPTTVASENAVDAGIAVIASAGNDGPSGYMVGSPSTGNRVLSVAALDGSLPIYPGANFALSTGKSLKALDSNSVSFADGTVMNVKVIRTSSGDVSLGCSVSDYPALAANTLAVVARGTCARVHKAIIGQKAGAAAVAMLNTSAGLPPFEGTITSDPDTDEHFTVTIPFFGVSGPLTGVDATTLVGADGGTVTLTNTGVTNTGYTRAASFTSGGPENPDSLPKPEVIAPGVSVTSTGVGLGNGPAVKSGTSMAAPMTAGVAALVKETHPDWNGDQIKAAIENTAEPSRNGGYNGRLAGSGVVQAQRAVDTVALATTADHLDSLAFGFVGGTGAYTDHRTFTITNYGPAPITYSLAVTQPARGSVTLDQSNVTVPAGGSADVTATWNLSAADFAGLPGASSFAAGNAPGAVATLRGAVTATPTTTGPGLQALRVPFLLVPRGLSSVTAGARAPYVKRQTLNVFDSSVAVTNGGVHTGDADMYAWGVHDVQDMPAGFASVDVRDVGAQIQPASFLLGDQASPSDRAIVFAVNTYGRWTNAATNEFDIAIDLQRDGKPDFFVVGVDLGEVLQAQFNGQVASFVVNAKTGALVDAFLADAPMNSSTELLPVLASDLGLKPGNSDFRYWVFGHSVAPGGVPDDVTSAATLDVYSPGVSSGGLATLLPGASATLPLWVDFDKLQSSPALGWLAVTVDDAAGAAQADEIPLGTVK